MSRRACLRVAAGSGVAVPGTFRAEAIPNGRLTYIWFGVGTTCVGWCGVPALRQFLRTIDRQQKRRRRQGKP